MFEQVRLGSRIVLFDKDCMKTRAQTVNPNIPRVTVEDFGPTELFARSANEESGRGLGKVDKLCGSYLAGKQS